MSDEYSDDSLDAYGRNDFYRVKYTQYSAELVKMF